ncbi:hypothetical protein BCO71033_07049 [Burkholderia contaminans]|uniref:Uncharacterized protein n=1 Tax=Burkholderia contaminans TaxID=488447 RepID=A0A6P3C9L2_9BURK|nr:hypothetical protein BCO71033_07049 [Burkholderia contaminans]
MFKYFPANYVWDLSVDLAVEMGVRLGEIEEMCTPQQETAMQRDAAETNAFRGTWARMADKPCALAEEDEASGRLISSGDKYGRAATYYLTAEWLQAHGAEGRLELYRCFLDVFSRGIRLAGENCERVEIPDGDRQICGLYVRAGGVNGPAPILVQINGMESTKEMKYRVGPPAWLAKRGVASVLIDQPGTGEASRLHGMHAVSNSELWRSAWSARAVSWCRTTGSTRAGSGAPTTWTTSCVSPRTSTSMGSSTASRCRSWSPTAPGIRRSRCAGPSALTSNWSTAPSAN